MHETQRRYRDAKAAVANAENERKKYIAAHKTDEMATDENAWLEMEMDADIASGWIPRLDDLGAARNAIIEWGRKKIQSDSGYAALASELASVWDTKLVRIHNKLADMFEKFDGKVRC